MSGLHDNDQLPFATIEKLQQDFREFHPAQYVNTDDCAAFSGLPIKEVRQLMSSKILRGRAQKHGRRWYVHRDDFAIALFTYKYKR